MAKNKLILGILLAAFALVPAGVALANTVEISVTVAAVASIEKVETEVEDGAITYTATVRTNSIKGYKLYVSSNGEDWTLVKTVDHHPVGEDLKGSVKVTGGNIEFKAVPIE
jgi:hypothetical protein